MSELRKLLDEASSIAGTLFKPDGQMMAHILTVDRADKRVLIACPMANADEERAFRIGVPRRLRTAGHSRWVFFSEAWSAEYPAGQSPQVNLPAHRPDRMEVVTFAATEAATGEQLMASRQIYRAWPAGPGRLLPLVLNRKPSEFVMDERRAAR